MAFEGDYWNANDKKIFDDDLRLDLKNIGISHGIGDVGEGLKANIFLGASTVELGFFGRGKGSRSNPTGHTPESYGKDEREEMRQLAKINEVELSTHAAPDLGALSGFDGRTFSKEAAEQSLHEVKRAVEFAADVAEGGPIVVHTHEFPRPMYNVEQGEWFGEGAPGKFRMYEGEEKTARHYLVDKSTGEIIQTVKNDEVIYRPIDKEGNVVWKEEGIGLKEFKYTPEGNVEMKPVSWQEYVEKEKEQGVGEEGKIAMGFFKEQNMTQIRQAQGQVGEYIAQYDRTKDQYERMSKTYIEYKKTQDEIFNNSYLSEEEKNRKWSAFKDSFKFQNEPFLPAQALDPVEYLGKEQERLKKVMESSQQTILANQARIEEAKKRMDNTMPIEDYGRERSSHNLAQAALYAYEVEKKKGLERPLWIAPENWAPEMYGSHPKEMRELILDARKEMEKELVRKNVDSGEAKKIAENHIKGTFDIGHLNFWKKYYEGDPEDFNKWVVKNVSQLFKEGIMANVHISDNFGYHDEHLRPGEGNAPIKEFLKELEKAGYKDKIIAEPGGQKQGQFHTPWTHAIGMNASPIYRVDATSRTWTDIQGSYFGRTSAPSYIVGDMAPSKDWTLWSQVPLE